MKIPVIRSFLLFWSPLQGHIKWQYIFNWYWYWWTLHYVRKKIFGLFLYSTTILVPKQTTSRPTNTRQQFSAVSTVLLEGRGWLNFACDPNPLLPFYSPLLVCENQKNIFEKFYFTSKRWPNWIRTLFCMVILVFFSMGDTAIYLTLKNVRLKNHNA